MFFLPVFVLLNNLCDNEEINIDRFENLTINDRMFYSENLKSYNSVKISFVGTNVCRIIEEQPRSFVFKCISTPWLRKNTEIKVVVDFERKICSLGLNAWIFILSLIVITILFANSIPSCFNKVLCYLNYA